MEIESAVSLVKLADYGKHARRTRFYGGDWTPPRARSPRNFAPIGPAGADNSCPKAMVWGRTIESAKIQYPDFRFVQLVDVEVRAIRRAVGAGASTFRR